MRARLVNAQIAAHAWRRARGVWERLLPPLCLACSARVSGEGALCAACWSRVDFLAAPLCPIQGVPLTGLEMRTAQPEPPSRRGWDRARSVMAYRDTPEEELSGWAGVGWSGRERRDVPIRLVSRFKYHGRMECASAFARWMRQAGRELLADADALVPVPMHRRRLRQRGFNQAAVLADAIAKLSGVPAIPDACERARFGSRQVGLPLAARRRNVAGAYRLHPQRRRHIAGRNVVLIDDVLTSGATSHALATCLKQAGARRVDVLTLARVLPGSGSGGGAIHP